jgi:hypothetical protein
MVIGPQHYKFVVMVKTMKIMLYIITLDQRGLSVLRIIL